MTVVPLLGNSKIEQNHFRYFGFLVYQESAHYTLAVECQVQTKDLISQRLGCISGWTTGYIVCRGDIFAESLLLCGVCYSYESKRFSL